MTSTNSASINVKDDDDDTIQITAGNIDADQQD